MVNLFPAFFFSVKRIISLGLHLDEQTRNKIKDLNEKISDLCVEFSKNCNEESTKLNFTKEQLGKNDNLKTKN